MLASLPFILLLILQGFARQDCAELLLSSHDLANMPVQAKSLKSFDDFISCFTQTVSDKKGIRILNREEIAENSLESNRPDHEIKSRVEKGYLEIQRSRDGPLG